MFSPKPDHWLLAEPPCWGSGEIPLLPTEVARRLRSAEVHGLKGLRAPRPPLMLSEFANANWTSSITLYESEDKESYVVDLVVDSLRNRIERWPLGFNLVIIPEQLDGIEELSRIPLLVDSVNQLRKIGKFDDSGIRQLLSSTFIEAYELIGDLRVVLDLFVTGKSWLLPGRGGRLAVAEFMKASSLDEEADLMALRYARNLGVSPSSKYYSVEKALGYGRRFGVSLNGDATLDECANALGLTRERFRQIVERLPVGFSRRQWPVTEWATQVRETLLTGSRTKKPQSNAGSKQLSPRNRENVEKFLSMYGLTPDSYRTNNDLEGRLAKHQLTPAKIERECYRASESLGFVHRSTVLDRLSEVFAPVALELLEEAVHAIHRFDLPDEYLYFEVPAGSSFFFGAVTRVLGIAGQVSIDELYQAATRHALYRRPQSIFPPRNVVRALLSQDSRFEVSGDMVALKHPPEIRLEGIAGWMYTTISEAPGRVIYRPELLDKARRAGHNGSSVQVFIIRHELFKTCGQNCVTLVGAFPTDREIESAHSRGLSVRVSTEAIWRPKGNNFVISLVAGTDLCDGGLLSLDKSLVAMFGGRRLRIMVSRSHHGHVGWSKGTTTGWATAMRRAKINPGDRAEITLDAANNIARVRKVN
jgi:hypothetical protein